MELSFADIALFFQANEWLISVATWPVSVAALFVPHIDFARRAKRIERDIAIFREWKDRADPQVLSCLENRINSELDKEYGLRVVPVELKVFFVAYFLVYLVVGIVAWFANVAVVLSSAVGGAVGAAISLVGFAIKRRQKLKGEKEALERSGEEIKKGAKSSIEMIACLLRAGWTEGEIRNQFQSDKKALDLYIDMFTEDAVQKRQLCTFLEGLPLEIGLERLDRMEANEGKNDCEEERKYRIPSQNVSSRVEGLVTDYVLQFFDEIDVLSAGFSCLANKMENVAKKEAFSLEDGVSDEFSGLCGSLKATHLRFLPYIEEETSKVTVSLFDSAESLRDAWNELQEASCSGCDKADLLDCFEDKYKSFANALTDMRMCEIEWLTWHSARMKSAKRIVRTWKNKE